jgi:hypothetical protein
MLLKRSTATLVLARRLIARVPKPPDLLPELEDNTWVA